MSYKDVGYYFKVISNSFEKRKNNDLARLGMTSQQMDILLFIYRRENSFNQKSLEEEFHLKNSTISGLLLRMEKSGLIKRQISPDDSRNKIVSLTKKSLDIIDDLMKRKKENEKIILKDFTEEEILSFKEYLSRAEKNVL